MLLATTSLVCLLAVAGVFAAKGNAKAQAELTVLGGEDVSANEYDFVVGLFTRRRNSRTGASCTGSSITERYVLTAAHCVENSSPSTHVVEVRVGAKRLADSFTILAEKWFTHEQYSHIEVPLRVYNDIALVKTSEPMTRYRNTALAFLPYSEDAAPIRNSEVTVVGFGIEGEGILATTRRGVLKKANMRVQGVCSSTRPSCIRAVSIDGRSCPGDSGGPMLYNGKVIGVSSTGTICTTRQGDAQYTRVSSYISWIYDKIQQG